MAGICMENTRLVTKYLEERGLYPAAEADEEGFTLSIDSRGRLIVLGSPLNMIEMADLLVSLALSGESRGQHWYADDLTLLSKDSQIPELILLRK